MSAVIGLWVIQHFLPFLDRTEVQACEGGIQRRLGSSSRSYDFAFISSHTLAQENI